VGSHEFIIHNHPMNGAAARRPWARAPASGPSTWPPAGVVDHGQQSPPTTRRAATPARSLRGAHRARDHRPPRVASASRRHPSRRPLSCGVALGDEDGLFCIPLLKAAQVVTRAEVRHVWRSARRGRVVMVYLKERSVDTLVRLMTGSSRAFVWRLAGSRLPRTAPGCLFQATPA